MLDLLRTKDIPEVQMKLLGLIQKWGLNFEDKKNVLPNFYSVYNKLRANNVQFPSDFDSNYQIYISENSEKKYGGGGRDNDENYEKNDDNDSSDKEDGETFYYMDSLKNVLKVPNFEHKYRRLVNFLVKMHDNIQMANLLIDSREHAGLKDIVHTLREGNNTLIDTISGGRLKDEKLMEITLGIEEDINRTIYRYDLMSCGEKYHKFISIFNEKLILGDNFNNNQNNIINNYNINKNKNINKNVNNNKNNNQNVIKNKNWIRYINNENQFNPSIGNSSTDSKLFSINHNDQYIMKEVNKKEINPIDDFDFERHFNNKEIPDIDKLPSKNINQFPIKSNNNNLINDFNSPEQSNDNLIDSDKVEEKKESKVISQIDNTDFKLGEFYMTSSPQNIPPPIENYFNYKP